MPRDFNGSRLRTARLYRGLTLTELGNSIKISKQALSLYENKKSQPDFTTVIKLSEKLHFPREYFYQKDSIEIKSDTTYFRSLMSTPKKSRVAQSTKVEHIGALYQALNNYINFPQLNLPNFNFDSDNISNRKIEEITKKLRLEWDIGNEPITDFQYLLEKNGIVVTAIDTENKKIDAFSQSVSIDDNSTFIIVIAKEKKSKGRVFFDFAHELGHIVLHPWTEDLETISNEEFKERERQANRFAGSFLMPASTFRRDISRHPTDINYYLNLKSKWNCSMQAMMYRAHDLNVISTNQYNYLMRQINAQGWRKKEPDDLTYFFEKNVFQASIDLLLKNDYSKEDILKILKETNISLHSDEIEKLLSLDEGTLHTPDDKPEKKKNNIIHLKFHKKENK